MAGRKKGTFQTNVMWINWSLTDKEKKALKATNLSLDDYEDFMVKLTESGHKVTVSHDAFNDCYSAAIVPTQENTLNKGFILTGKGSTPLKAIKQACYIHFSIFNGDWSTYSTRTGREEIDD